VTTEALQKRYPNLFERLADKDLLMRHLIVVDENDEDILDDDINDDLYDPSVYSHVVYLHAPVVQAAYSSLGSVHERIRNDEAFEDLFVSEQDLWGVVTGLDEETIALRILDAIEAVLSEHETNDTEAKG
jgi:hypothetical protein